MIDKAQHKLITAVMDMLNGLTEEDFEEAEMTIDVSLKCRGLDYKVVFDDIGLDWAYTIEQGNK